VPGRPPWTKTGVVQEDKPGPFGPGDTMHISHSVESLGQPEHE